MGNKMTKEIQPLDQNKSKPSSKGPKIPKGSQKRMQQVDGTTITGSIIAPASSLKSNIEQVQSAKSTISSGPNQQTTKSSIQIVASQQQTADDYKLLLTPMFSAMNKITDHLFLTGVGGMTKENFRKNHIDFVVNITIDAPLWEDVESLRLPLEDDINANILPHLNMAVDKINEVITKKNAHVLVHCVAGVSRSATIVIAYLMKYRKMDLKTAFNYCSQMRPVVRPNNGFMQQLINYEMQLFGKNTVHMVETEFDGTLVQVPDFFLEEYPRLVQLEALRVKNK